MVDLAEGVVDPPAEVDALHGDWASIVHFGSIPDVPGKERRTAPVVRSPPRGQEQVGDPVLHQTALRKH